MRVRVFSLSTDLHRRQQSNCRTERSLTVFLVRIALVRILRSIALAIARATQTADEEDEQDTPGDASENDEESLVEHGGFSGY